MRNAFLPLVNTITLLGAIFINYWANTGALTGKTVGEISNQYDTLFTPAVYTFSIWGFIYLSLLSFVAYQWYCLKKGKKQDWSQPGWWFAISNLLNGSWIVIWLYGYMWISIIVIVALLFTLIMMVRKLNMEMWDAPISVIAFVWWPIAWYLGWIILATVANIASFLVRVEWIAFLSAETWTILMILVSTGIYAVLIQFRNLREASLVGIWGLVGISVKQWERMPNISYTALWAVIILVIMIALHGYDNLDTSPWMKWKRGEI